MFIFENYRWIFICMGSSAARKIDLRWVRGRTMRDPTTNIRPPA